jgi:primosomal protein N' (replication factor Y) (superfamily II helicase)
VPQACPSCRSTSVARHGAGTERLATELAELFDDGAFPIFRLDADVAGASAATSSGDAARAAAEGSARVLRAFQDAPAGLLIGTQMVAKGHDFPGVRLGIVLDADATLRFPDFRAEERTFALVAQLAGRIGRGGRGTVLVQTIAPEARAIVLAARHDSDGFLAGELERRRQLGYPPYSHLIRVVCSAQDGAAAAAAAREVRARMAPELPGGATVLGPAALFRLRGRERWALVLKAGERRGAVAAVGDAVAGAAASRNHAGVSFSVDVDPQ